VKLAGCTALITGASAGIGREFARQLGNRAAALVLVARRTDRLEELRAELTKQHPALKVHTHTTDLSKHKSVSLLYEWLQEQGLVPDLLINNAGSGDRGTFATSDFGRVNEMQQVNVVSLTLLTRKLLPPMLAARRGAIINVSSSAGFLPIPGMAVYAATKAYVSSFSEALRMELRPQGIAVSALCPGPVHTEFDRVAMRAEAPQKNAPEITYVAVEEVVRDALIGIENNRALVIPGLVMKAGMFLLRLTPMPVLRLVSRFSQ
jgi:short-subunit dehydrogenase